MDLPLSSFESFLKHAFEQEQNKSAMELWKSLYPFMLMKKLEFMSFEDYKKELTKPKQEYTEISHAEIEEEMMHIISAYEEVKKGGE